nr:uncharacterized protein LOC109164765 [Ipomoea trifida]
MLQSSKGVAMTNKVKDAMYEFFNAYKLSNDIVSSSSTPTSSSNIGECQVRMKKRMQEKFVRHKLQSGNAEDQMSELDNLKHRTTCDAPPPATTYDAPPPATTRDAPPLATTCFAPPPVTTCVAPPPATTCVAPPQTSHQKQRPTTDCPPPALVEGQHWGEIDLYVEHGIDEAELVTHLPLPEPEHVDDIQEDVEEDPGVGTQVDNGPGVVSQAENDQVQSSGGEFSDEEADLESNQEDGDSDLERSPLHEAGFVDVECGNVENRDEEIRSARVEGDTENVDLGGEKDDAQSEYYDSEDPLSYQSEFEEVGQSPKLGN